MPTIADWIMVGITGAYVVATIFICIFNGKSAKAAKMQIEEMQQQQKQNAGIQLYSIRKEFLLKFQHKEFDEIYWDAAILFSESVANSIQNAGFSYEMWNKKKLLIAVYEERLRMDRPDLLEDYHSLLLQCDENTFNEDVEKKLFELCDSFKPIYSDPMELDEKVLDYRALFNEERKCKWQYESQYNKAFFGIIEEIQRSIS